MSAQLLRRDGRAPCLRCPQSPTHVPGGDQAQDHILQASREAHPFATGTDGASGSRKHTRAPRQQIKCSLAGRTWGLVLSCPRTPMPGLILKKLSPWQCQAAGLSWRGPLGPRDPGQPWPDLPMAHLACPDHLASCVHAWASSSVGPGQESHAGPGSGGWGSGDPWPLGWTLWQGVQKALLSVVGGLMGKGGDHGPRQNRSRGDGWARRKVLESGLGGEGPPLSVSPSYTQAQAMPWEQWACLLEPWTARSPPPLMRQGMHWPGEEGALLGGLAVPQHFTWA